MIPFDFEYYKPDTYQAAVSLFQELDSLGKQPLYYAGGTEIISMSRLNTIFTKAVIDIKGIPECNSFELQEHQLKIGAAVSLTGILESNLFPLLSKSGGRVADHTIRDKITLGGNICGKIPYREAVLPLLLADSLVVIAGTNGINQKPINDIFQRTLQIEKGELIIGVIIDKEYLHLPHIGIKKTRMDKIDYPLISLAALKKDNWIRVAISGLCSFPFRSKQIEEDLNDKSFSLETRIANTVKHLPGQILSDIQGSAEYRDFVIRKTLFKTVRDI